MNKFEHLFEFVFFILSPLYLALFSFQYLERIVCHVFNKLQFLSYRTHTRAHVHLFLQEKKTNENVRHSQINDMQNLFAEAGQAIPIND